MKASKIELQRLAFTRDGVRLPTSTEYAACRDTLTRWLAKHHRVEAWQSQRVDGPMKLCRFDPECLRVLVIPHRHGGSAIRLDGFNILTENEAGWHPLFMGTEHGISEYDSKTGYAIDHLLFEHKIRAEDKRVLADGHRYVDALALRMLVGYLWDRDTREGITMDRDGSPAFCPW